MEEKELKALISLLDDDDRDIQVQIESKIISLGTEIIPHLEEEWGKNFNPRVQERIEELIHTLQFSALKTRLSAWKESGAVDLLEGMWLIATYQYPDLEFDTLKQDLEQVYYEVWMEFRADLHPFDQVKILNSVIFNKLKFSANTKNFHSPSNSMINIVLESKRGNPISLCVLYKLIADRLDLPIHGVNLPKLFILTYKSEEHPQFYINAFNRGLIFLKEDIDNYIDELRLTPIDDYYEPCTHLNIVLRVLRNLEVSFDHIGDHAKSDEVKELILQLTENG